MQVNCLSLLDAVEINGGDPVELQRLVYAGAVFLLRDLSVQVRLQEHLVAVRKEIFREPHGRQNFGCPEARKVTVEENDHCDDASSDEDCQDDQDHQSPRDERLFGHDGSFLRLPLRVLALHSETLRTVCAKVTSLS